jgi:opacity protein-like surface antigen
MRMLKRCLWIAAFALGLAPGAARADFLFTPYAGMTFGKDASGHEHGMYGVSFNWMGKGIAGAEIDLGYSPNFFEPKNCTTCNTLTGSNNVLDLMFNGVIGVPIGGQKGIGVRPYGLIGFGLLRQEVPGISDAFKVTTNDFGFDVGGGTYIFFSDHWGIRGDLRYLRSLQDNNSGSGSFPDFAAGKFDFWRWTAGVTIR